MPPDLPNSLSLSDLEHCVLISVLEQEARRLEVVARHGDEKGIPNHAQGARARMMTVNNVLARMRDS